MARVQTQDVTDREAGSGLSHVTVSLAQGEVAYATKGYMHIDTLFSPCSTSHFCFLLCANVS